MDANKSKVVAVVLRVLLAAVFMVSAVAKLMAIDDFELYVFSYGFFSLNATYILVRLCIAVELLTGLLLALGWWRRWVNLLALAMLLFFSLFLCYAALAGRNESCQCFGRLAEMNPGQSLLKNAVLIVLTLLYMKLSGRSESKAGKNATRVVLTAVLGVAVTVGVFCVSVPDNWMFRSSESRYDQELFEAAIAPDGALEADSLSRGPQLVAFVTPGCPFCRMSREKLESIAKRNHLDTTRFHYYEPADLPEGLFLDITYGQRPLIILMDDGRLVATYHYRNINEREISRTLAR
ncbi:MAG: DoxX family membrane protein [Bacteroidales bacterium]|nr:DoxX family membrane protein [Bacteroidales bacterium]